MHWINFTIIAAKVYIMDYEHFMKLKLIHDYKVLFLIKADLELQEKFSWMHTLNYFKFWIDNKKRGTMTVKERNKEKKKFFFSSQF